MRGTVGVLVCLVALCTAARQRYDNYKVVDATPLTTEQADYLRTLQLNDDDIDFWTEVHRVGHGATTFMVSPQKMSVLAPKLHAKGIAFEIVEENVQRNVDEELMRLSTKKAFDINDFNNFADIEDQLSSWASGCASGVTCRLYDMGSTTQGRTVHGFSMSTGSGKPAIVVDATTHAREWLSTATILKIMDHFVNNYASDAGVKSLLDSHDWYFFPVVNPDGYVYSWTSSRYWRKNRRLNPGSSCYGTDLNRNYNYNWGREGVSHSPCSDLYCGSSGASELETQAVQNEITRIQNSQDLQAYVTFHSYGRMWMHPWGNTINFSGFTCERASDHAEMYAVAVATADAIEATYNTRWARGTSCEVIYETTGASDDWAKGVAGVKFPFNPELRGNDFVVNRNQINPSFVENWNGLVAMVGAMKKV